MSQHFKLSIQTTYADGETEAIVPPLRQPRGGRRINIHENNSTDSLNDGTLKSEWRRAPIA